MPLCPPPKSFVRASLLPRSQARGNLPDSERRGSASSWLRRACAHRHFPSCPEIRIVLRWADVGSQGQKGHGASTLSSVSNIRPTTPDTLMDSGNNSVKPYRHHPEHISTTHLIPATPAAIRGEHTIVTGRLSTGASVPHQGAAIPTGHGRGRLAPHAPPL